MVVGRQRRGTTEIAELFFPHHTANCCAGFVDGNKIGGGGGQDQGLEI